MRNFHFYQKNSSANMFIRANSFEEAEEELKSMVSDLYGWRCDDEEGEEDY